VERATKIILIGISKLLVGLLKGKWAEKMTKVVWSHNTIISTPTEFTLLLLFGDEAMTPEEAKRKSIRVNCKGDNNEHQCTTKDMVKAIRLKAADNSNKYQNETKKWINRKVKVKQIKQGFHPLKVNQFRQYRKITK
jgi:hypothetical protein